MKVLKGLVLTMLVSTATIFAADPSLVEGDLSTSDKVAAKTTGFDKCATGAELCATGYVTCFCVSVGARAGPRGWVSGAAGTADAPIAPSEPAFFGAVSFV